MSKVVSNIFKSTGNVEGHWAEYEEQPEYHEKGYFWMRKDGLRFGLRLAGKYLRPGEEPVKWIPTRIALKDSNFNIGQAEHDGIWALPNKLTAGEELPTHIRFMRDGEEIERVIEIDGISADDISRRKDGASFVMAYADKRWPYSLPFLKVKTPGKKQKIVKKKKARKAKK